MGPRQHSHSCVYLCIIGLLLCGAPIANGQLSDMISALFGGNSATPAPTVVSQTTSSTPSTTPVAVPQSTPAATTAADATSTATPAATTAADATPTATPAATTAAATATPDDTPAAAATTTATPTATTKAAAAATTAASTTATPTPVAAAAASTAATATAVPKATPTSPQRAATKAAAPPPPPIPIEIDAKKLVDALPADETQAVASPAAASNDDHVGAPGLTAADLVVQVAGNGVTPFGIPQQSILLRAAASVMTTASLGDLRIRYVTSSANLGRRLLSEEDAFQGRRLLQSNDSGSEAAAKNGDLYNVATVTLSANCSNTEAVPSTLTELQSIMQNGLLASALQSYGATTWGVSFLSVTAVDPTVAVNTGKTCKKSMGTFCLDKTSLSVAGAEAIIGIGSVVVLMLLCIPCVLLEYRRRSGKMAELDPTPPTPRTPMDKMQKMYNNLITTVKQASPLHKGHHGRNAFSPDTPTGIDTPESGRSQKARQTALNVNAKA